jgi:hypothetical protein
MRRGGCFEFSMILSTIKKLLDLHSNFEMTFVKRQTNLVAHMLAKTANFWTKRCIFYLVPPYIENLLSTKINLSLSKKKRERCYIARDEWCTMQQKWKTCANGNMMLVL